MLKEELRRKLKEIRKNIQDKDEKSKVITQEVMQLIEYQNSQVIALYKSFNNEVDTSYLINNSLLLGKTVLLPRVVDDRMIFIRIDENTKYDTSRYGIVEPIGDEYLGPIDLMIVPGLGFSKDGDRLGYGMGYYDRYLKDKNTYTIGLCFDEQIVTIPTTSTDIKMNKIIIKEK